MGTVRPKSHLLLLLALAARAVAHAHNDDDLTNEELNAPVDAILWIHMALQCLVWGILFPLGMVLGISRSRWHVPLQSAGFALTVAGIFLGHSHGGREFYSSVHGPFAKFLMIPIIVQLALGIYLKLHIHEQTIRPYAVKAHGILGKAYPILGWLQILFGAVTFNNYCRGGNLGQCLAHYIMGSAFIGYGIIMVILLLAGEAWIRRSGRSPEWWDSWVIMLWGIVNTFTEHHGGHWSHKDMQHTSLGVIWWAGGACGIWLSRKNQRSVVPSIIIIVSGWAMSQHAQALELSTKVHSIFGIALMLAGLTRLIEVCFLAPSFDKEAPSVDSDRHSDRTLGPSTLETPRLLVTVQAFRHFPPFLLIASGLLFMSATDEEMVAAHAIEMDHVTYVLLFLSLAFFLYTFVLVLIHTWANSGRNAPSSSTSSPLLNGGSGGRGGVGVRRDSDGEEVELSKWYHRVPNSAGMGEADAVEVSSQFVIGEHEDERERD